MTAARKSFYVSATHKSPNYRFERTIVKVSPDGPNAEYGWYADHPELGCSKTYRTIQDAIYCLFHDHACSGVTIHEEVTDEATPPKKEVIGITKTSANYDVWRVTFDGNILGDSRGYDRAGAIAAAKAAVARVSNRELAADLI